MTEEAINLYQMIETTLLFYSYSGVNFIHTSERSYRHIKAVQQNNVKVIVEGSQPMLFAHGYGCDQNMWRYIIPAFEKEYKLVLFDHIGFGQSDSAAYSKDKYSSLEGYAADILQICKELRLENVIFVGHSVSAMIGVLAAIEEPALFSKMILIAPSPRYINDGDYIGGFSQEAIEELLESLESDYLGWSEMIAPVIMGNADRPELSREQTQSFCQSNRQVASDFARITFLGDNRSDLKHLQVDTLILQCTEDVIAPLTVGTYMHENLPKSKLMLLEANGHCPNLSAPAETITAMSAFLEALIHK